MDDSSLFGLDLLQEGQWSDLPNGEGKILRFVFESKSAHSISLEFLEARFPAPMELYIFSPT